MFAIKRCHFGLLPWLLVWLFLCGGCASLKPSAANIPPDQGGGLAISDDSRTALAVFGTCASYVAQVFAGSSW